MFKAEKAELTFQNPTLGLDPRSLSPGLTSTSLASSHCCSHPDPLSFYSPMSVHDFLCLECPSSSSLGEIILQNTAEMSCVAHVPMSLPASHLPISYPQEELVSLILLLSLLPFPPPPALECKSSKTQIMA